jgi:hypothetical protein
VVFISKKTFTCQRQLQDLWSRISRDSQKPETLEIQMLMVSTPNQDSHRSQELTMLYDIETDKLKTDMVDQICLTLQV